MTSPTEDPAGSLDPRHLPQSTDAAGSPGGPPNPGAAPPGPAARFEASYAGTPPWDIGRPQPAFLVLADSGQVTGRVLDVGCGTGEHALMAAARGLEAVGVDAAPTAIERARRKAAERGLQVRFVVMDALAMGAPVADGAVVDGAVVDGAVVDGAVVDGAVVDGAVVDGAVVDGAEGESLGRFDTVLDCGLFHVLTDDDRLRYLSSLRAVTGPGSRMFLLCFSDRVPGDVGPRRIRSEEIVTTFSPDWDIDEIIIYVLEITTGEDIQAWRASLTRH